MRALKLIVVPLSVVLALAVGEITVRITGPEAFGVEPARVGELRAFMAGKSVLYEPFPYVGYVARSRGPDPTMPEDWRFELAPKEGVVRIACLGGSTTWGNYPRELKARIEELTGHEVQVMNWGVPGWSSMETMVNYFVAVQRYHPDIVVVHQATNDTRPRVSRGFRPDYGHWRKPWTRPEVSFLKRVLLRNSDLAAIVYVKEWFHEPFLEDFVKQAPKDNSLRTLDDLPEGSEKTFEQNIHAICQHVERQGAHVVLVTMPYSRAKVEADGNMDLWAACLDQQNGILRRVADEEGCLLVDLAAEMQRDPDPWAPFMADRVHVSAAGNERKAAEIADALIAAGYLEAKDGGGRPESR